MTYDEAVKLCQSGKLLTHPDMGEGWTMVRGPGETPWFRNPHNGQSVGFPIKPEDKDRTDWAEYVAAPEKEPDDGKDYGCYEENCDWIGTLKADDVKECPRCGCAVTAIDEP